MNQSPSQIANIPATSQKFPPHIMGIVQAYQLGAPQRKLLYGVAWLYLLIGIGVFLAVGLCNLANVSVFAGTPLLTDSGTVVTRSAFDIIIQDWQTSAGFLLLGMIALGIGLWGRRYVAYECSEGFVEMAGRRVKQMMYWKTIQRTWTETTTRYIRNGGHTSTVRYYLLGRQGETIETSYKHIWQRANYEITCYEFTQVSGQMLAEFYAGRPVIFDQIYVDQQGVHIPGGQVFNQNGWLLPLQAIVQVRVRAALTFEMHPASHLPAVHTISPENVGLLILFLQAITNGRILAENHAWPMF